MRGRRRVIATLVFLGQHLSSDPTMRGRRLRWFYGFEVALNKVPTRP